jgi:hypothetical protein
MLVDEQVIVVNKSGLFDERYYRRQIGDVEVDSLVRHYFVEGVQQGFDPHPLFHTSFYLNRYKDVAEAGVNPLVHYILHGAFEGRAPNRLFDSNFYLSIHHRPASGVDSVDPINPLRHYANLPLRAKVMPHKQFDPRYYMMCYPEVVVSGREPLEHYLRVGCEQGRRAAVPFDHDFYLTAYPDVAGANIDPLEHYTLYGRDEGRLARQPIMTSFSESLLAASLESHDFGIARRPQAAGPVYWGSSLMTNWEQSLFKDVVEQIPQVEFYVHQACLPPGDWDQKNLHKCSFGAGESVFQNSSIFINPIFDGPISELMLAAVKDGLLIIAPEKGEISALLHPRESSLIPAEVLSAESFVHAITYAIANADDTHNRANAALQSLIQRVSKTDTTL